MSSPFLKPLQGPPAPSWEDNPRYMRIAMDEEGNQIVFFTISALAAATGKKAVTIKQWLTKKYIPEPGWRSVPVADNYGQAGIRLWTKEQIKAIVRIATEEGVIPNRPEVMNNTRFPERVFARWEREGW